MAFVDEARIFVKAGDGGKGCESFYRDKSMRYPRPDGGDGGGGGDIVFQADSRIHTLLDYRFKQHYKGERGGHGSSKNKKGRAGKTCVLRVPPGTILRDHETRHLIRDLTEPGESVTVVRGGAGGRGNNKNRNPKPPGLGEEKTINLELKVIADVGVVGFPNAGKSTLVSQISKVRTRIASYHFTTKQPILGMVEVEERNFIVADLPGLIEGAHIGKGLGDRFLKHAERTKILVHLVDMSGSEGRDPLEDYAKISAELKQYGGPLSFKEKVVVANKMDLPEAAEHLARFRKSVTQDIIEVSAIQGQGLDPLVERLSALLQEVDPQ